MKRRRARLEMSSIIPAPSQVSLVSLVFPVFLVFLAFLVFLVFLVFPAFPVFPPFLPPTHTSTQESDRSGSPSAPE
jgi:hypothetical protein